MAGVLGVINGHVDVLVFAFTTWLVLGHLLNKTPVAALGVGCSSIKAKKMLEDNLLFLPIHSLSSRQLEFLFDPVRDVAFLGPLLAGEECLGDPVTCPRLLPPPIRSSRANRLLGSSSFTGTSGDMNT